MGERSFYMNATSNISLTANWDFSQTTAWVPIYGGNHAQLAVTGDAVCDLLLIGALGLAALSIALFAASRFSHNA